MQSSLEIQPKAPEVVDSIAVPIANGTQPMPLSINPIFSFGCRSSRPLTIQLPSVAALPIENIVATTYQGGVRQRFWQRNYLAVAGGFVRNDYENNQLISAVSRRDNYYYGKLSSSRDLTERGTVELAYEHRTNDSSVGNFGFNENLVSLAASLLF